MSAVLKKIFPVLLLFCAVSFSGCALFLLGGGAATGYAISDDEVEGMTDRPMDEVYSVLEQILDERGMITARNATTRTLEAILQDSEVNASVEQISSRSVRFRVKARRAEGLFPHMDLAQSIASELYQRL